MTNVDEPKDLVAFLGKLFPEFEPVWREAAASDAETAAHIGHHVGLSYHRVLQVFAPVSAKLLNDAPPRTLQEFCNFLNESVTQSGDLENAISTCLLEHASQVGIRGIVSPFLSQTTKKHLR